MFPQGNYRYLYPTNKKTATVSEQRRKELKTVGNLRVPTADIYWQLLQLVRRCSVYVPSLLVSVSVRKSNFVQVLSTKAYGYCSQPSYRFGHLTTNIDTGPDVEGEDE